MADTIRDISELPPDTNRGYIINILIWVGGGISTICVILRIYSRIYIIQRPGWDDAIVVCATLLNVSTRALTSVTVAHGLGRHIYYLSSDDIYVITYYNPILETLGIIAYCLPKLAIVILIKKLMGTVMRGIWFLYGVIVVLFVTTAVSIVIVFLECNPPGQTIHPFSSTRCIPIHVFDIVNTLASAWSAFTDLVLAISPAIFLWNLQMKMSRKITVILIMALGFFAMIAAIAKTLQLPKQNSPDTTYDIFWLCFTFAIETDLVIIASCAPAFPKLWVHVFSKRQDQSALMWYHSVRPPWYGYQRQGREDEMIGSHHTWNSHLTNGQTSSLENRNSGETDEWY
ncbi:hypothetical protein F5B22DRAFT_658654 [Xylaria bambusicola]|uniref:uncharacterized protein n=1 Tax=Xylaria bambusicola TaxID=326684 RepID=UPI002008580A|nr:uncharacterized protein F5B22DRAFT_658654 [Xylaria bambusicola]KAI0509203.1 hypothetical protein F5B22DRAFT_658654 [Xylaria bambusicola]